MLKKKTSPKVPPVNTTNHHTQPITKTYAVACISQTHPWNPNPVLFTNLYLTRNAEMGPLIILFLDVLNILKTKDDI